MAIFQLGDDNFKQLNSKKIDLYIISNDSFNNHYKNEFKSLSPKIAVSAAVPPAATAAAKEVAKAVPPIHPTAVKPPTSKGTVESLVENIKDIVYSEDISNINYGISECQDILGQYYILSKTKNGVVFQLYNSNKHSLQDGLYFYNDKDNEKTKCSFTDIDLLIEIRSKIEQMIQEVKKNYLRLINDIFRDKLGDLNSYVPGKISEQFFLMIL